ncbi:MAG: hypothetical protein EXR93_03170 [Gemmatimonadetes bacterium]|nr:hypothetical protein [Gemmatimonadota bacterium]
MIPGGVRSFVRSAVHFIPPSAWPPLCGLFVFVLSLWAQPGALVGSFYDDGVYVTLAKALAEGQGYRNIHLPGSPASIHYPVLYPAALSLLWRLWPSFPANVVLFQLFDAATLGAGAWLIARGTTRWPLSAPARYAAMLFGFLAFPLLTMIGVRFSEPLFLVLLLSAVAIVDRPAVSLRGAALAGVLAGLAVLTRSIGVSVVGGIVIALWVRGERPAALVSLGVAVVVAAPWFLWVARHAHEVDPRMAANYGTYATEAGQAGLCTLIPAFDLRNQSPMARLAIPSLPFGLWYPLALLLMAFVAWGAVLVWQVASALVLSLALYTAIVGVWPYVPDRFMWILTPLVALFLAAAFAAAWRRGRVLRGLTMVLVVALVAGFARRNVESLSGRVFTQTAEQASLPIRWLAPAIEHGSPPDAVIATEAEAGIYLYSGRRVVLNSPFRWHGRDVQNLPPDSIVRFYCDAGVTHIALFAAEGGAAPVVALLEARNDSSVTQLFRLANGPALYRFRCPR